MFKGLNNEEMMQVDGGNLIKNSISGIVIGIVGNEVSRQVTGKSLDEHFHNGVEYLKDRAIETSHTNQYSNNNYGYPIGTMK